MPICNQVMVCLVSMLDIMQNVPGSPPPYRGEPADESKPVYDEKKFDLHLNNWCESK